MTDRLAVRKTRMGDSFEALPLKLEYFRRSEKWAVRSEDKRVSESIFIPTNNDPLHTMVEIYRFIEDKDLF